MVIERFKHADPQPVGERFEKLGRMLPAGLKYHASWVDVAGSRCFQVMETADPKLFADWLARWKDLIDFEIVPVLESAEFWAQRRG